ncbi:MAG: phosphoglucosamine mutase, partial [Endomicrobiia bacterium]
GIKFFNSKGMKLADAIETKLEKELVKYINDKKEIVLKNKIKNQSGKSLIKQYQNFLISLLPKNSLKNKKIIIDCANGASYKIAQDVLKKLKATVVVINNKPTGKNINLNCGALHPEVVSGIVKKENAFCGFAFDGDADRVIAVDDKGVVRDGDYFLAVVAKHLKGNNKLKNNTLVITVMANLGLLKAMKEAGINTVVSKVGDRYVYEDLKKHKAILGGEQSGHIIFKNLLDTGDGIISALQLLNILVAGSGNNKLSDLCSWIKKYPQILINEKVVKKVPIKDLPETSKLIKNIELKLADNGRVLVRYSGTENLLRVMIEGQDKTEIKKLAQDIINIAKQEISKL